ncbi:MAG: Amidohydrolase, partial [Bacteroidetes bacterium]|nr:Amidohydrolase [Bacteroidota bacterium]
MKTHSVGPFLSKTLTALCFVMLCLAWPAETAAQGSKAATDKYLFHDSHFHLTNYVQEGTDIQKYMEIMGTTIGRSTLFG